MTNLFNADTLHFIIWIFCAYLLFFTLASAPAKAQQMLQTCIKEPLKLTCGEYRIHVSDVVIDYDSTCQISPNNIFLCPQNVTSILQNACDGCGNCDVQWDILECLPNTTGNRLNRIKVNYSCEPANSDDPKIMGHCSDTSISLASSSTQWSTSLILSNEVDTTENSENQTSVELTSAETSAETSSAKTSPANHAPSWNPFRTSQTISYVQTEAVATTEQNDKDLIIYGAAGGGAGCILIVVFIIVICCCKKRRHRTASEPPKDSAHLENGAQMTPFSNNRTSKQSSVEDNTTHTEVHHDLYAPVTKSTSLMNRSAKATQPEEDKANYIYSSRDKPEPPPIMPGIGTVTLTNSLDDKNINSEAKGEDESYESVAEAQHGYKLTQSGTCSKHYIKLSGVNNNQYHAPINTDVSQSQYDAGSVNNNQLDTSFMSDVSNTQGDTTAAEHNPYDIPLKTSLNDNEYDAPLLLLASHKQNDAPLIPSDESTPVSSGDSSTIHIQSQDYVESYAKTSGDNIISSPSVRSTHQNSSDVALHDDLEYDYADMTTTEGSLMDKGPTKDTANVKVGDTGTSDDYSDVEIQHSPGTSFEERVVGGSGFASEKTMCEEVAERTDVQPSEKAEKDKNSRNEETDLTPEGTIMVENNIYNN